MLLTVLLTTIHILVCLVLIGVIMLQTGKRADLAGAFGGGGSQTAFGARGAATFLSRATTVSAVIFMMTSFGLALLQNGQPSSKSVLDAVPQAAAPVTPVPATTTPSEATPLPGATPPAGATPPGDGRAPEVAPGAAPALSPEKGTETKNPPPAGPAPVGGQGN